MNRTIFLVVVSSTLLFMQCKDKGGDKPSDTKISKAPEVRYISPKAGLNMRDKPDTTGALVVTVPYNSKVEVNEVTGNDVTISGATGKWTKITWNGKTGWAFGGFLGKDPVATASSEGGGKVEESEALRSCKEKCYQRFQKCEDFRGTGCYQTWQVNCWKGCEEGKEPNDF